MCAETHAGLHVRRPLLFSDFNQNWNVSTHFSRTLETPKLIREFLQLFVANASKKSVAIVKKVEISLNHTLFNDAVSNAESVQH
jgi:hypothetical protein